MMRSRARKGNDMIPDLKKVKEYAKTGKYRRIPVAKEILSDSVTTIEALRILRNASRHCFILESASQEEHFGRYSFLGFDPVLELSCLDGLLTIRKTDDKSSDSKSTIYTEKVDHPGSKLRELLSEYKSPQIEELPPFTGGLVGYFSYDYIKYAEPKLGVVNGNKNDKTSVTDNDFKDIDLMLFNDVIVFDHYRQKLIFITGIMLMDGDESQIEALYGDASDRLDYLINLIRTGDKKVFPKLQLLDSIEPVFSEERYCSMVKRAKEYIHEGDIFQVVLSNPMTARANGSLFDAYRILRSTNPSPYMFYFSSDDIELSGASPETLVRIEDGTGSTFPLAGTRPRGRTPKEDAALEAELLSDEKERAEHNMLVDLGRNDMGKISKTGSVKVKNYMEILRFSHVMHIGSTVTGTLRDDKDAVDVVDAILPAGTLSGAPKFRACEIIEELEVYKRGVYGGAIGYLDFAGNLDTCIAIRLVYKKNGQIVIRSGAGIVADSVPQKEFEECKNKAQAVISAIHQAEEIQ